MNVPFLKKTIQQILLDARLAYGVMRFHFLSCLIPYLPQSALSSTVTSPEARVPFPPTRPPITALPPWEAQPFRVSGHGGHLKSVRVSGRRATLWTPWIKALR